MQGGLVRADGDEFAITVHHDPIGLVHSGSALAKEGAREPRSNSSEAFIGTGLSGHRSSSDPGSAAFIGAGLSQGHGSSSAPGSAPSA
eukprot:2151954-Alexandrium_andersonii.AAC.1